MAYQHSNDKIYDFDYIMSALAILIWFKVILAIESNRTVGPMLKMIIVMTKDLVTFIVLWSVILIFFLCVG